MKIIIRALTGSRLYGTHRDDSDWDYRGCFLPPIKDYFRINPPKEIWEPTEDDTVYYSIKKLFALLINCNPNILDIVYAPKYEILTFEGSEIIGARNSFLSKNRIYKAFSGYSIAQMKRLENHKRFLVKYPRVYDILNAFKEAASNGDINRNWIIQHTGYDLLPDSPEKKCSYGIGEFKQKYFKDAPEYLLSKNNQQRQAINKLYKWVINRNPKRRILESTVGYDVKHAGHCLRLLYSGIQLLEEGDFNPVLQGEALVEIQKILKGEITLKDFKESVKHLEDQMRKAYDNSELPEKIQQEKIEGLLISIIKGSFNV